MRPPCSFLVVPAGRRPFAALPPQSFPLLHVQADGLAQELAHGAAFLLDPCCTCSANSGGMEKVIVLSVLALTGLGPSFCPSVVGRSTCGICGGMVTLKFSHAGNCRLLCYVEAPTTLSVHSLYADCRHEFIRASTYKLL